MSDGRLCGGRKVERTRPERPRPDAIPQRLPGSTNDISQDTSTKRCEIYISKYDYDSRTNDDLSFKKGDLMYIITMDEDHWWFARSQDMAREGYVPSNYVAEWKSMEAEE